MDKYNLVVNGKVVFSGQTRQECKVERDRRYAKEASVYVERSVHNPKGPSQHSGPPEMGFNVKRRAEKLGVSARGLKSKGVPERDDSLAEQG